MAPQLYMLLGYHSVSTQKMVSTQWRKLPLPDMLRRTPQSPVPHILDCVSAGHPEYPRMGLIVMQAVPGHHLRERGTSSQNNSRISLLKHYKDGLNNYGLCLPRTYHFRLSRRWFLQFQDPRHSRRTFKTIPLSA